jgi:subtilisin family serine protease
MSFLIEPGLKEKYEQFAGAAERSDASGVHPMVRGAELSVDSLPMEHLGRMAQMSLNGTEEVREVLQIASSYLPDECWSSLIVMCEDTSGVPSMQRALDGLGFHLSEEVRKENLAAVGAAVIDVPPLPGVLERVGELENVDLLGDGDREMDIPSPVTPEGEPSAVGPVGALMRTMMDVASLPEDPQIEPDSVRVAVLDSGIDPDHCALNGRIEEAIDFSPSQVGPVDPVGHGTHVAGIIAGLAPEKAPALGGLAPFARLLDLQLFGPRGGTSPMRMLEAIGYAVKKGVDVMNLSFGARNLAPDGTFAVSRALEFAASQDVLPVVAAGNEEDQSQWGRSRLTPPADAPSATAVAAIDTSGRWAPFSCVGPTQNPEWTGRKPTVAAPGVNLISARSQYSNHPPVDEEGLYTVMSGTSMAAPMISGLCALGVAYLRGKGAAGDRPVPVPLVARALAHAATDNHGEGWKKLGSGVPQVWHFLQELDRLMRFGGQPTDTAAGPRVSLYTRAFGRSGSDSDSADEPAGERPAEALEPMESSGLRAPSGEPDDPKDTQGGGNEIDKDAEVFNRIELNFVAGVKNNLREHAAELAKELFGARKAGLCETRETDEQHRIMDLAAMNGFDPDGLPLNREFRGMLEKGRKTVARVYAKSFAFSLLAANPGILGKDFVSEDVREYVRGRVEEAEGPPCVFSLFLPGRWPAGIGGSALSGEEDYVLLCDCDDEDRENNWFEIAQDDCSWYTWLALTPMSFQRRKEWCIEKLTAHLRIQDDVMGLPEGIEELGLPEQVGRPLISAVCDAPETPLESGSAGDLQYIKRTK